MDVFFQTLPDAFKDDKQLLESLEQIASKLLAHQKIELERSNYEDGAWSGWFNVSLPHATEAQVYDLANELLVFPGMTSVMLRTDSGEVIPPPEPLKVPQYKLGVRLDPLQPK